MDLTPRPVWRDFLAQMIDSGEPIAANTESG